MAIGELTRAGLQDRDYENLPTAARLRAHAAIDAEGKLLVCDCADVEPGLEINRFLLSNHAEEIVDGALIAAVATSTPTIHIHVAAGDGQGAEAVACVVAAARGAAAQGAAAQSGGAESLAPAIDVVRAPFVQNMKGYEERPTLVLTAETLVQISRVLAQGAERFRQSGTPECPGTKLFQLSGAVKKPGIYELPLGTSLRHLVEELGGGLADGETLQAVIVGGSKGACYRPGELDLPLDFDTVKLSGGIVGSGEVAVLSDKDCLVDQAKRWLANTCFDTCGKCSLGREGSYQLREIVTDATRGKSKPSDVDMLLEIGRAMRLACACPAGKNAPNVVVSSLEKFPEEFEAHMRRKKCDALVCEKYVTFHILPDLCDGCGECVGACPEEAIEGGRKKIHVIDQDACEKCGKCLEICNGLRKAVVKAGAIKPKTPKKPIPVGSWNG